ncbi:MAG: hypothetical protein MHM6MM_006805 [Cercozoa sp. M6MM]
MNGKAFAAAFGVVVAAQVRGWTVPVERAESRLVHAQEPSVFERMQHNYNNRIRDWSTPEKIFDTFSSVRDSHGKGSFMTLADFCNAILPADWRDAEIAQKAAPSETLSRDSVLRSCADADGDGLISFGEFVFFWTLAGVPERDFDVALKMFDVDGDGSISLAECVALLLKGCLCLFKGVLFMGAVYACSSCVQFMGVFLGVCRFEVMIEELRKPSLSAFSFAETFADTSLCRDLFGDEGIVSIGVLKQLLHELRREIRLLEFARFDVNGDGTLSAEEFALAVISYATRDAERLLSRLRLVLQEHGATWRTQSVSLAEFEAFNRAVEHIDEATRVLRHYSASHDQSIQRSDLRRAFEAVCGVALSDTVIEVLFRVFDADADGHLSLDELSVLLRKRKRNAQGRSRKPHFGRAWNCIRGCFRSHITFGDDSAE